MSLFKKQRVNILLFVIHDTFTEEKFGTTDLETDLFTIVEEINVISRDTFLLGNLAGFLNTFNQITNNGL